MSCRYCGGEITSPQKQQFGGEYCCLAHKTSYEEALLRLALGQEPEAPGYILQTKPQPHPSLSRPYPAQVWRPQTMPQLPRLSGQFGESVEDTVRPLVELVPEAGTVVTPEAGIDGIEARGMFPYHITRLDPVGRLEVATVATPERNKRLWWQDESIRIGAVSKGLKSRPKGNPQPDPKGFTGALPMNQIVQASFKSLRNRSLSGDYAMAETVNRDRAQGLAADLSGVPAMQLPGIRQSALRASEEYWRSFQPPVEVIEALDFLPAVEYSTSTALWFRASGFNFKSDPDRPSRNGFRTPANEPALVNVRALLNESDPLTAPPRSLTFEPISWEELDELDPQPILEMPEIPALAAALELYEPPAVKTESKNPEPLKATPAEPVLETPLDPPPICDLVRFPAPKMRAPADIEAPSVEPLATTGSRMHMPVLSVEPLRLKMSFGPKPEPEVQAKPAAVVPPQRASQSAPAAEVKAAETKPAEPKPTEVTAAEAQAAETKTAVKPAVEKPAAPKLEAKAAETPVVTKPPATGHSNGRKNSRGANRSRREHSVDDPIEEPTELSAELEDAIAQGVDDENFAPEPVEAVKPAETKPAPLIENRTSLYDLTPATPKHTEAFTLGISQSDPPPAYSSGIGNGARIGIAAAVLAAVGGIGVWQFGGSSPAPSSKAPVAAEKRAPGVEIAGSVVGEPGWAQDWVTDAKAQRIRQIAFYRPSTTAVDYRAEFQAEVEYKAVSWVVRAPNVKNHIVLKIVQVKGGAQPVFNLVRQAVRDGKPDEPVTKPIEIPMRMGQVFKVRTDAIADRFTVTIQDKVIDQWTDAKLLTGGFGVANEGAERGQIRSIQMWYLKPKSN